ncbi:hypothetical protein [Streptomyces sp. NBC_01500]|uniref:hypothetical protein n=1 Tax=Streptomyces sp. NBC_01500 TaxID=2903886 RepID=UPI0022581E06|nr:hypothetical protein [Streptomyces sp. NBC_01500]MCX4550376.1 hypothetical protein [Streptomyces sp. NBC_01500]
MSKDAIRLPEVDKDWAVPYQPADFLDLDRASTPLTGRTPAPALVEFVHQLIAAEGPIHEEVLLLHAREVLHLKSFTAPKKRLVVAAVEQLVEGGLVAVDGEFFDLPGRPCRYARRPFPGLTKRTVERVAPAERQTALAGLIRDEPRRPYGEVVADAVRFFGWTPGTPGAKSALAGDLYRLRDQGRITGWPDSLVGQAPS